MMQELHNQELHNIVKKMLDGDKIKLFIGYREGFGNAPRPAFVSEQSRTAALIFDERCKQNLVTYLHKPEVKKFGKIGIFANMPALRAILQLASENQVKDGDLVVLTQMPDGKIIEFDNFAEIEKYLQGKPIEIPPPARQRLEDIKKMSREERFKFWSDEFANCIKCYACRAACPMCYCAQCTVECNQPQWINISSNAQGNLEWHIIRAMHMAGRCISCGECARACPVDIPLALLSIHLNDEVEAQFGERPGFRADFDYPLSSFKVEDKENFIR